MMYKCVECGGERRHARSHRCRSCASRRQPRTTTPLVDRFWTKVNKTDGCWIWTGALANGYGTINPGRGEKLIKAHRFSWEMANGQSTGDLCVLHRCDNPRCVRPDHLFLGTPNDNVQDMISKGRDTKAVGVEASRAKLREDEALEIRMRYARGQSSYSIGRQFGISACNAWSIATHKTWRHLP